MNQYALLFNIGDYNLFFNSSFINSTTNQLILDINRTFVMDLLKTHNVISPFYFVPSPVTEQLDAHLDTQTWNNMNYRLIEMACLQLFYSAKARAALKTININMTPIVDGISTSLNTQQEDLYSWYASMNRDTTASPLNFTDCVFLVQLQYHISTIGTENNYLGSIGGRPSTVDLNIQLVITDH